MALHHNDMAGGHVTPDGVVYHQQMDSEHDDLRRMDDNIHDSTYATEHEFGTDDDTPHHSQPRAVHQCNICNKIFVSFKGLQQHAVIHTDQKPFGCDICGKAFRFKSNLFEHRSVHSGFTPHACPYCGKTCRLKGNLKKHLKTHVSTKEELEEAWKPFASNRRPPADIPDDAIIVRSAGEPFFTPPSRPRKRKLGLGPDARPWIEKIRRGELLPSAPIVEKMRRLSELLKSAEENSFNLDEIFEQARALSFERFDCPICKVVFMSRLECVEHIDIEHPMARTERPLFCEVCLRTFADRKAMEQHESYHKRVHLLIEHGDLEIVDPEILLPETCDVMDEEVEAV
ncbi:laterally symmetric protein 2 [Loa loa]|uniref:Laterally symmetric protein 2 n=1 Tax=Loa loa TaxID=7209 RepID=A0A1I7V6G7_LOALO|nr:laterally symmetric protein 2 [Loa loa]EFO25373.1 laterally symmetric protein 2 [Loa loa]